MSTFEGIPTAAFRFYAELEENNNREWWLEHKTTYDAEVREPLTALLSELEPQFGPAKIFRPNRDIRFSQDKSPYKTAQGAFAAKQEGVGFYLQISADGLLIGGGYHSHTPAQLGRFRTAVDAPGSGEELQRIVEAVAAAGFTIEGEKLKTVPKGFDKEHPRGELLKHKSLSAGIEVGQPEWLSRPSAKDEIASRWEVLRPLVEWVGLHAAP
ncbi:DUF2461 domain-containing protein [Paenarthrobacter aurescens]|uniref:TIGR02453 family protein n=1 Tax=Paenarthrobacter aurescens TaxID=43663 RepID=A0A4Y3NFU2_PAEAU|nr:DUF2461 domain-containing protein [Paenarthrobacter aurescens]MDO6144463.1 DUF2461 domain-containing protein [Paenarthrobacter aurescens]MDO6148310.1 DUF2461 domain-containing protein [Paenarthrobacter aurescens]MDO6159554.1 DUF2461 domain-containing protein [Paenarthrobacter aurescens]MDO6163537.1 DUF2461 domain-containing protein [Paenarthrobacter aurescens]GEB18026.1 TIGR02453 family protein [Paenarthrobacter aurescens]